MIVRLAVARLPGLFHVTNQGPTTWYDFARDVVKAAGLRPVDGAPDRHRRAATRRARRPGRPTRCSTTPPCGFRASPLLADHHEPLERVVRQLRYDADGSPCADSDAAAALGEVAAVVVNYNARHVLSACLASLRAEGIGEIVVVDNGSADGSESVVRACDPAAVWLSSGANIGYGRAANLGAGRTASRPSLLVCNPDVVVRPGTVAALLSALEADPPSASSGPGCSTRTGRSTPRPARSRRCRRRRPRPARPGLGRQPVQPPLQVARLGPRRRAHRRLGLGGLPAGSAAGVGRDRRIRSRPSSCTWRTSTCAGGPAGAGWAGPYEPAGEVTHVQGVSTNATPYRMIVAHHRSLWRFAQRTTAGWRRWLLPVLPPAMATRAGFACCGTGSTAPGPGARRRPAMGPTAPSGSVDPPYGKGFFQQKGGPCGRHQWWPHQPGRTPWMYYGDHASSSSSAPRRSTPAAITASRSSPRAARPPRRRSGRTWNVGYGDLRVRQLRQGQVPPGDHRPEQSPRHLHARPTG